MCLVCNSRAGNPVLPVFVLTRIARSSKKIKKNIFLSLAFIACLP